MLATLSALSRVAHAPVGAPVSVCMCVGRIWLGVRGKVLVTPFSYFLPFPFLTGELVFPLYPRPCRRSWTMQWWVVVGKCAVACASA